MTETLYKLTNELMCTGAGFMHRRTQWHLGKTLTAPGGELCTSGVLHAYRDPRIALMCNKEHANFHDPRLFEATGVVCADDGAKVGCTSLTLIRELELPTVRDREIHRMSLACLAQIVPSHLDTWFTWAKNVLPHFDTLLQYTGIPAESEYWYFEHTIQKEWQAHIANTRDERSRGFLFFCSCVGRTAGRISTLFEPSNFSQRVCPQVDIIALADWAMGESHDIPIIAIWPE